MVIGPIVACVFVLVWKTRAAQPQGEVVDISIRKWDVGQVVGGLAVAADGYVWYSMPQSASIGRLDPRSGAMRVYPLKVNEPTALQLGNDGSVWFASGESGVIGRLNGRSGKVDLIHTTVGSIPTKLAVAPNGNVWFISRSSTQLGLVSARSVSVSHTAFPTQGRPVLDLAATPEGSVIFIEAESDAITEIGQDLSQVGRYELPTPAARPNRIGISADGVALYTDSSRGYVGTHNRHDAWQELFVAPHAADDTLIGVSGGPEALWVGVITRDGLVVSRISKNASRPPRSQRFMIRRGSVSQSTMVAGNRGDLWFISEGSSVLTRVAGISAADRR